MRTRLALALALSLAACASAGLPEEPGGSGGPDGGPSGITLPDGGGPGGCVDSDNDGVCDVADVCPGHDDTIDADGDTIPDACDTCPGEDDRADINANGVPDCSERQTRTIDLKIVGSNGWRGWHTSAGSHSSSNDNTLTGIYTEGTYRSYFTFPLTGFSPGVITKVTLELELERYVSNDPDETFSVWDVTTPANVVEANSGAAIYNDLGTGRRYATATVTAADLGTTIQIPLDDKAIADVTAKLGQDFVVGVNLDTASAVPNYVRFGHTPITKTPVVNRIVVEYLP